MTPRTLVSVLDDILEVVPGSEASLRARLESVRESAEFTAPEAQWIRWQSARLILEDALPMPIDGWQAEVRKIFVGGGGGPVDGTAASAPIDGKAVS